MLTTTLAHCFCMAADEEPPQTPWRSCIVGADGVGDDADDGLAVTAAIVRQAMWDETFQLVPLNGEEGHRTISHAHPPTMRMACPGYSQARWPFICGLQRRLAGFAIVVGTRVYVPFGLTRQSERPVAARLACRQPWLRLWWLYSGRRVAVTRLSAKPIILTTMKLGCDRASCVLVLLIINIADLSLSYRLRFSACVSTHAEDCQTCRTTTDPY